MEFSPTVQYQQGKNVKSEVQHSQTTEISSLNGSEAEQWHECFEAAATAATMLDEEEDSIDLAFDSDEDVLAGSEQVLDGLGSDPPQVKARNIDQSRLQNTITNLGMLQTIDVDAKRRSIDSDLVSTPHAVHDSPPKSTKTQDDGKVAPVNSTEDSFYFTASAREPIVRPPFPKGIPSNSPMIGASSRTMLRTCFRVGEALRASSAAEQNNVDGIVELYARVLSSWRCGWQQHYRFGDLFSYRSPILKGVCCTWKSIDLWEQDARPFLGASGRGKMCRALGRIKRSVAAQPASAVMTVLSIWQCSWDDVCIAHGALESAPSS